MRLIASFLGFLSLLAIGLATWEPLTLPQQTPPPSKAYESRIVRDEYGVPHIFGKTDADVAFGVAYAHAEDDFATLQEVLAMSRGRYGVIKGADGAAIDYVAALLDVWATVDRRYDELPSDVQLVLEGYAAGLNLYASEHDGQVQLSKLFPMTGRDVAAGFVLRSPFFFGLGDPLEKLIGNQALSKEGGPALSKNASWGGPTGPHTQANGSNAYAVAPTRSKEGKTWLISNSHQPLRGAVAWYELVVHSEEAWDFAGATFPGSPYPFLGHNKNLGWTNTVNRPDLIDIYKLELNESRDQYRFADQWLPLHKERVWLRIKFGPFVLPVPQSTHRSIHGPVIVNEQGAFAIRYAAMDQLDMLTQYYRLNKAQSFDEWKAAMSQQGIPATNFVYADKEGNIALFYNAMFPDRAPAYNWRGILPGDDPRALWSGSLPFDQVPALINPASGYVMNANNTPFVAAGPGDELDRSAYSPLLGVEDDMTNRAWRSIELLESFDAIGEEELRLLKYDTTYARAGYAQKWMDQLLNVDVADDPHLAKAQELLANWDWNLDGKGQGDVLALILMRSANEAHYGRHQWPDPRDEMKQAADYLLQYFDRLDPNLQDVLRLRQGGVDLPLTGGNDTIKAATLWDVDPDGRLSLYHGDSFIMWVDWSRDGSVRSRSIHPFGAASTRPGSPHYTDQMQLYADEKLKPVHFDPAELKAHKKSEKVVSSGQ